MKNLIGSLLIFAMLGCTSIRMRYEADVENGDNGEAGHYTYEKSYSTTGSAVSCWISAVFYGGWCWTYLAKPWGNETGALISDAQTELHSRYKFGQIILKSESTMKVNWESGSTTSNFIPYQKFKEKPSNSTLR